MHTARIVGRFTAAALALMIGLLFLASSCSSYGEKDGAVGADPATAAESPFAAVQLAPPSAIRVPSVMLSSVFKYGGDFDPSNPSSRAETTADQTCLYTPNYTDEAGDLAYATYVFDLGGYDHHNTLNLEWAVDGDYLNCYVGLANFIMDAWTWYEVSDTNSVTFDGDSCVAAGMAYVTVILTGRDPWELDCLYFGSVRPADLVGALPLNAREGEEVTFVPHYRTVPTGEVTWAWDFGGGATPNTPTDEQPVVTIGAPGVYACTVTASNAAGSSEFPFYFNSTPAGGSWQIEVAFYTEDISHPTSLALEHEHGYPWIAVSHDDAHYLTVRNFNGVAWQGDDIHTIPLNDISNDSLAFDSANTAHLAFWDNYFLVHGWYESGEWQTERVDSSHEGQKAFKYFSPSLVVDSSDNLFFSYSGEGLWGAEPFSLVAWTRFFDHDWDNVYAEWHGGSPYVMQHLSPMDVDQADLPGIVTHYVSAALNQLRLLKKDPTGYSWTIYTVRDGTDVGLADLAISKVDGTPYVCYILQLALGVNALRFSYYDGAAWQDSAVDAGFIGGAPSMVLTAEDHPLIAYYNLLDSELDYAYHDGTDWQLGTVDSIGDVGSYCDVALDAGGEPHFSYYDSTNHVIKYARPAD